MSVEEACKKMISFLQDQHYAELKEATDSCIKDLSCKLYSHNLISKPVRDSPTFDSIVDELQAGLVQMKYFIQLRLHYERFLDCLSAQGGPSKIASDKLYQEWKIIKKEFEELDLKEERRKRTELITNKQLDEYLKQRNEKFEIVAKEVEFLKTELKLSQDENRRLLEKRAVSQPMIKTNDKVEAGDGDSLSEKDKMRRDLEDQVARVKELEEMVGKLKKDKEEVEKNYKKLRAEFQIRLKNDRKEIQILKAEVNAYSREVDEQNGLVTQSQEKHKTEANEIASMRRLANTSANKDEAMYSQQQLDDELARMRQQLNNAFANEEELLRAYHEEQAAVTNLEQQLNSTRKDLDKTKEESAVMSTRLESVTKEISVRPYQQHPQSTNIYVSNVRNIPIVSAGRGKKGHQYQEKNRRDDDDSDSDIEENKLIDGIDEEIQQMAEDVRKGSRGPITAEVLFDDGDSSLPYDPNLVCPKCGIQYRVGEIQKLRRHMNEFCTGIR